MQVRCSYLSHCFLQALTHKSETCVGEHQKFDESCEEYITWHDTTIQTLQELHNSAGSKDDVENRLIKLKVTVVTFHFKCQTDQ